MPLDQHTNTLYDLDMRFPPLSRTVAEVSNILATNGAPDTDQLIQIVHQDPLVVTSVLKRINSAYYGMRRRFEDLRKAVVMIGFIEVSNIVLASGYIGFRKLGNTEAEANAIDRIMRASIGAGYITNLLIEELDMPQKSTSFTVGLLHNIGRLVLLYNHPDDYVELIKYSKEYLPTPQEEREMLGIDHLMMGSIATQHWNFPDLITRLIESYETPGHLADREERNLGMAIKASVHITHKLLAEIGQFPDWYANRELDESEENDSIFPLSLKLPTAVSHLARQQNQSETSLFKKVNDNQKEILEYIEHLVKY